MSRKHYMSIFLNEELHEALEEAVSDGRSKSGIGRSALEMYLGLMNKGLDWLEIMSSRLGKSKWEVLEQIILERIEDYRKAITGEDPESPRR